jgi:hypothetical protein
MGPNRRTQDRERAAARNYINLNFDGSDGHALANAYARASMAEAMLAKVLTQDEARRIATNRARLKSGQMQQVWWP